MTSLLRSIEADPPASIRTMEC